MEFIGKWNDRGDSYSVGQHLRDTESVMERLITGGYIPPRANNASGLNEDVFKKIAVFLAAVHDIGKVTSAFQAKVPGMEARLFAMGLRRDYRDYAKYSPHAFAGAAILNQVYGVDESVCDVVAAHHGRTRCSCGNISFERQKKKYWNVNYLIPGYEDVFRREWDTIYNAAIARSGIQGFPHLSVRAQILLTGLLIMADWIASNSDYFPFEVVADRDARAARAFRCLDLKPCWVPRYAGPDSGDFLKRFGFLPNALQVAAQEIAGREAHAGLMIIESGTGTGKTEAALSAAELLSFFSGSGGVYFGLPTQATANGLLPRIAEWAKTVSADMGQSVSIRLSHSGAKYNEFYKKLCIADEGILTVNQWLSGRHRALLPDFVDGTVDQLLFAALCQKFFMLLHLGIVGKTVIIDEVHAYDAYMDVYLTRVLEWLGAYGAPVILLSATLTEKKRAEFIRAYTGVLEESQAFDSYPAITWADSEKSYVKSLALSDTQERTVRLRNLKFEDLAASIRNSLKGGGCAGVIVNKVAEAQEISRRLHRELPDDFSVLLLHARFLPRDRAEHEKKILERAGKRSTKSDRYKLVVVGTQVLEQSLDLDFDILYTELPPIDLLLQRIGRLQRHVRDFRPEECKVPVCYIFEGEGRSVYNTYLLRRTREVLAGLEWLRLPEMVKPLIEAVYDLDQGGEGADKEEYKKKQVEMETRAANFRLPKPETAEFKFIPCQTYRLEGVRYGLHTMAVLLLKRDDEGRCFTFSGERIEDCPDSVEKAFLHKQCLSLRYDESLSIALREQMLPDWTADFIESVMVFNRNGFARYDKKRFHYTEEEGLEVIREV